MINTQDLIIIDKSTWKDFICSTDETKRRNYITSREICHILGQSS